MEIELNIILKAVRLEEGSLKELKTTKKLSFSEDGDLSTGVIDRRNPR